MAYKTPEQMLELILKESLLTDACMTIIDGRNEYGFHAVEIPSGSIEKVDGNKYELVFLNEKQEEVRVPVEVPANEKETALWLIKSKKDMYDIVCIQHDANDDSPAKNKQKEYMSVIAMFLDHYGIGTRTRLLNILKYGYEELKKEIGEDNEYELLRDSMNAELDIRKAEYIPDKYGVRFDFSGFLKK